MRFIYKTLLDEKEKKRREGWDAKGNGKWQKCQHSWLACPP